MEKQPVTHREVHTSEAIVVPETAELPQDNNELIHDDDPVLYEREDHNAEFVHVGLMREDELHEKKATAAGVANSAASYQPPTTVSFTAAAAKYTLMMALKQRYAPHSLHQAAANRARHTAYEYLQITENAFWRLLDLLWANESFRIEMTNILQAHDRKYNRNVFEPDLSTKCDDASVLTVPHSYKELKYVQNREELQQASEYLQSLGKFEWLGLDTQLSGFTGNGVFATCETIEFAISKESFIIDARMCRALVSTTEMCRFLTILFTREALFGFWFEDDDRNQIAALVNGNSEEEVQCRAIIQSSTIFDVRELVDAAYTNAVLDGNANQANGPVRMLPDYVRNHPRLSHYVHYITKKKMNKSCVTSIWSVRPYLKEQMAYAHMKAICIVLLLQHTARMPAGRMIMQIIFGNDVLADLDYGFNI